jgi:hypothetical protein
MAKRLDQLRTIHFAGSFPRGDENLHAVILMEAGFRKWKPGLVLSTGTRNLLQKNDFLI